MKPLSRSSIATAAIALATLLGATTQADDAQAQPPAETPPAANADPSAEQAVATAAEAKELNRQGIALLDAGDLERALDHFVRSRKVLATTKNTTNTAIVLDRLGRFDESLELYEELLLKYAGGLDDEDRSAIAPAMAELRQKVGSVAVGSSVGGAVFIDERPRGKLPLVVPVRVLPGSHTVRVTRAGYQDFAKKIDVGPGQTASVEAVLSALEGVGQMVVEEIGAQVASVFVDGVDLGKTPWEGSLAPGQHLVWLSTDKGLGTAPTWVQVVGGQSALVRLHAEPLGPPISVRVEPKTATIDLDGVQVGAGRWEGRLPIGKRALSVLEAGYHKQTRKLELAEGSPPVDVAVKLEVDPDHPRWPKKQGEFLVELYGGPLIGPSLGGSADEGCPDACDSSSAATGLQIGARGGYRFPFGLALELGGGYLTLGQSIERTLSEPASDMTTIRYDLSDESRVQGPFFHAGASFRAVFGNVYAGGRANVGVLVARSRDNVSGTASTTGPSVPLRVQRPDESTVSAAPFLGPEAIGGVRLGPIDLGLSLGLAFYPAVGGEVSRGRVGPVGRDGVTDPAAVDNVSESNIIDEESVYGPFWVFAPAITAAATF